MKVLNIIRKEVVRVDDDEIVELFLKKDESAIIHTAEKYGCRLRSISQRITADILTAEECENDTYLEAWNRIPPNEPRTYLIAFLSKRNQIVGDKIVRIVNDRERLYREYFLLYNDQMAKDTIRVYYPKNGENWIRWDRDCSVDVKVNLSRGTEYGFCRIGFSYSRIEEQDFEKSLKVAYVNEDREIFRFEHDDMLNIDDKKILWAW